MSTDLHRLKFQGICRSFGRLRVLHDVNGGVEPKELLLVVGANGSGKSTLLRCLTGLMSPQRGSIDYHVGDLRLDNAARRHAVGYLSPDLEFYSELSTLENLQFFARLRGVDVARGGELLDRLGLPKRRAAGALSSGMRQRLRWAWALLHQPRILLLDEPLSNLDGAGRRDVLDLLAEHLETGAAIVANPDPLDLPQRGDVLELAS